jgi:hypothetical protein
MSESTSPSFALPLSLSFDHLEADVRLLACAPQPTLALELETDGADEVAATSWMARGEIDTPRMSPGCSACGDTPLRHTLGRTAPRRGARRPPPTSRGARRPPLGDELEEMAELLHQRPPSPSVEQCAQEARSHLVSATPQTARHPLLLVVIRAAEGAGHG